MSLSIVRASTAWIEPLAQLFDSYRQFYGQSSDMDGARLFLSERLEQEQSVIFVALKDGIPCGFTQLYPAFSSIAMRPIWILNDLFVAPDARRHGVGESLMQAATEFAVDSGAKRLVLATASGNWSAQALYEKLGWDRDDAFLHYLKEL
ncbi:GNAT family N-acetyltransferase [bacterium]|nr:GNAT family N-acetyltransferase [bacterium]